MCSLGSVRTDRAVESGKYPDATREAALREHEIYVVGHHEDALQKAADDGLDPDDYDGDLHYRALGDLDLMIGARRAHDKLGPLFRWAKAHVDHDPGIADATPIDKVHHFTKLLPNDLSGRHALSHLRRRPPATGIAVVASGVQGRCRRGAAARQALQPQGPAAAA